MCALCLNAGVAQYPITDTDGDDAGLLWVATHGDGLICVDSERAAITRVVTVTERVAQLLPRWAGGTCG
jgi:hypothetical protein